LLAIGKVETVKNEKVIMGVVWLKCYLKVTTIKIYLFQSPVAFLSLS